MTLKVRPNLTTKRRGYLFYWASKLVEGIEEDAMTDLPALDFDSILALPLSGVSCDFGILGFSGFPTVSGNKYKRQDVYPGTKICKTMTIQVFNRPIAKHILGKWD